MHHNFNVRLFFVGVGVEANCVCLDVQYLMFTLIIFTKWRVLFFICFFPRERVSHHSRIGLHRGLNRTKFMPCVTTALLKNANQPNISVWFF